MTFKYKEDEKTLKLKVAADVPDASENKPGALQKYPTANTCDMLTIESARSPPSPLPNRHITVIITITVRGYKTAPRA